jgi:ubiquitin-like protein Pup
MSEQTTKKDNTTKTDQPTKQVEKDLSKDKQKLTEEMDSLIEDIDAVLEENAEEFVKNYIQRGGQLLAFTFYELVQHLL